MRGALIGLSAMAAAFAVVLVASGILRFDVSTGPSDDPEKIAEEFGWFPGTGGRAIRWEPAALAGTGTKFALTSRSDGAPTILYNGAGGGGMTYTSGWAVEADSLRTATGTAYVGVTIADAATVRFGKSRDALRVPTTAHPGDPTRRLFAVHVPVDGLSRVHPNDIVALDAKGRLLGRQHFNDGHGGFGAMDGIYDRTLDK